MAANFETEFANLWKTVKDQQPRRSSIDGDLNDDEMTIQVRSLVDSGFLDAESKAPFKKLVADGKEAVNKAELKRICQENQVKIMHLGKAVKEGKGFIASGMVGHRTIVYEEVAGIARWINRQLKDHKTVNHLLPLADDGLDIFEKVSDGTLLCELINMAVPETIDPRAINTKQPVSIFAALENLKLGLTSASSIGCTVVSINPHTFREGNKKQHLVLGVIWQIIEKQLFEGINVQELPSLAALLRDGEDINDLLRMAPTEILMRWVNHQLEKKGVPNRINNFKEDIKDSVALTHLVDAIAPKDAGVTTNPLKIKDLTERADGMLDEADKIDCKDFISAGDVVKGQEKLVLAFVANLLNNYPNLEDNDEVEEIIETREEKTYRNWMNSLGVKPKVKYMYTDLDNGLILFQLFEFIQPGIVNWKKVVKNFHSNPAKSKLEILQNCNYAVTLGKELGLSLHNTGGSDLYERNKTLVLGMVWQLMRAYTLTLLQKLAIDGKNKRASMSEGKSRKEIEDDIVKWSNDKLQENGKPTITGFKDKTLTTAMPVLNLLDAVKPGTIDFKLVIADPTSKLQKLDNASYAVSMARKIGAPVYALPEDLAEGKYQMIMTIFACIMLKALEGEDSE